MAKLARVAKEAKTGEILIEGHTDDTPIHNQQFPSNWELSTARAISVVRYFVEKHNISPQKLSALGFGEFRPIADNDIFQILYFIG